MSALKQADWNEVRMPLSEWKRPTYELPALSPWILKNLHDEEARKSTCARRATRLHCALKIARRFLVILNQLFCFRNRLRRSLEVLPNKRTAALL